MSKVPFATVIILFFRNDDLTVTHVKQFQNDAGTLQFLLAIAGVVRIRQIIYKDIPFFLIIRLTEAENERSVADLRGGILIVGQRNNIRQRSEIILIILCYRLWFRY